MAGKSKESLKQSDFFHKKSLKHVITKYYTSIVLLTIIIVSQIEVEVNRIDW